MPAAAEDELQLIDCGLQTLRGLEQRGFPGLRSGLVKLNLHSNHLTSIDIDLRPCADSLRELNLSSNDLRSVVGLEALPCLTQLNLSSNGLRHIDRPLLCVLPQLRRLNLSVTATLQSAALTFLRAAIDA